ncbi:MAG: hypothetical protein A2103_04170 [Gammaproteobacteria bacterium GWF2_41_13]|nr:MAG: hypothetical protein A2103_04170 [Gammaproteobacteria bacterium GWF2_41_13]
MDGFFESLMNQTDQDFDILVVNDSCGSLEAQLERYRKTLRIHELQATGSLANVRQVGFEEIFARGYKQVVFGDFDDCFMPDRVAKVRMLLRDFDIIVNDVSLFGDREDEIYFSRRIKDRSQICLEEIFTKNFMGFSNTAVRAECLKDIILADTIAVDWYLFSRLLARGARAVFCAEPLTNYRQHADNMATFVGDKSKRAEVKLVHYQSLKRDCPELISAIDRLGKRTDELEVVVTNPFWWED